MRCRYVVASRNCASACVARQQAVPAARQSIEICRCRVHRTAIRLDLRRSSPSTSAAAAVRVLPLARQARSGRLRAEPRSGSRRKLVAMRAQARNSPCNALEFLRAKVVKLKQVAHELSRALCNHDAVRLRNALQARGKVRRLAHDGLLLRSARSDQVADNHQTRCDADARLQGRVGLQPPTAATNSSPARTARSASSSWAWG